MKTLVSLLLAALVTCLATAQGTLIQRIDMSSGAKLYLATAVIHSSGWEFWAFGESQSQTLDLEFGRLCPVGKGLLLGGYATYWPDSKKWFALPWLNYSQKAGPDQLTANLAAYVPLNGGPRIIFSDETSLVRTTRSLSYGIVASFWKFGDTPAILRLGPTVRLPVGNANLKLNYQPWYLSGKGRPVFRVELSQRF